MKSKRVVFAGLLFLTLPQILIAEQVTFKIHELGTGDPIQNATVAIVESENFAETNQKGEVSLEISAKQVTLKILAPSYEVLERTFFLGRSKTIYYLEPLIYAGDEIVVTANRVEQNQSKLFLDGETLKRAPGNQGDPLKTIQSLPGVVSTGEQSGGAYVRGTEWYDMQVWANNMELGYLYHFGGLTSTVHPQLVEDFNLILGGYPVRYDDTLGGVIDIKLREPKKDRLHGSMELSTYVSGFMVEGPTGFTPWNDSMLFAARRSYIDALMSPEDFSKFAGENEEEEDRDQFTTVPRFYDIQAMWHAELPDGHMELKFFEADDKLAFINNGEETSDPAASGEFNLANGYQSVGFNWRKQWNARWSHNLSLSRTKNFEELQIGSDPISGQPFYVSDTLTQHIVRPELFWQINDNSRWSFGSSANYVEVPIDLYIGPPPLGGDPEYNLTESQKYKVNRTVRAGIVSAFTDFRHNWTPRWETVLGVRHTMGRASGGVNMETTLPRVATEYKVNHRLLLTASWGKYVQIPLNFQILEGFGNPKLTYRKSEHRILGMQYELNPTWTAKLEAYHNPLTDLVVDYQKENALPPDNYANDGKGVVYGAELFLQRKATARKLGWISYTYARSKRTDQYGVTTLHNGDQPHTLTAVWGQPMTGGWKKWDWGVKVQWHSGKLYTPIIGRRPEPIPGGGGGVYYRPEVAEKNSARLPDYFKADLRLDRHQRYNTWKLTYYIDLQNVTFHENIIGLDYGKEFENTANPKKVTGLLFMPFLGVEAEF
ncbi:MAG: TonB-dependent receptor plug domain-containing protein [Gammaproteobacteria bacterium]|nr:TonB-dependent receptor plug domain-containing protein [Gammaproteobacteria bacterium]